MAHLAIGHYNRSTLSQPVLQDGIPRLRIIVTGVYRGLSSIAFIFALLMLVFYIYAILGLSFFAKNDPWHFKNLHTAMLTLFRASTFEDWTDIYYIKQKTPRIPMRLPCARAICGALTVNFRGRVATTAAITGGMRAGWQTQTDVAGSRSNAPTPSRKAPLRRCNMQPVIRCVPQPLSRANLMPRLGFQSCSDFSGLIAGAASGCGW